MERDKVIKALECCPEQEYCGDCPYDNECMGMEFLMLDALSLIKELTEENERLKSVEFTCGFIKPHKVLECPIFDEIVRTKADTVRKMQERLKQAICDNTYPDFDKEGKPVNVWKATTGYDVIDQIAKEMLEEGK